MNSTCLTCGPDTKNFHRTIACQCRKGPLGPLKSSFSFHRLRPRKGRDLSKVTQQGHLMTSLHTVSLLVGRWGSKRIWGGVVKGIGYGAAISPTGSPGGSVWGGQAPSRKHPPSPGVLSSIFLCLGREGVGGAQSTDPTIKFPVQPLLVCTRLLTYFEELRRPRWLRESLPLIPLNP